MDKITIAKQIVRNNGACGSIDCRENECPGRGACFNCFGYEDQDSIKSTYIDKKLEWFKNWLKENDK